jgi:hypothetical protein
MGNNQITVSLERRMACGIGKCGRCKIGDIYMSGWTYYEL